MDVSWDLQYGVCNMSFLSHCIAPTWNQRLSRASGLSNFTLTSKEGDFCSSSSEKLYWLDVGKSQHMVAIANRITLKSGNTCVNQSNVLTAILDFASLQEMTTLLLIIAEYWTGHAVLQKKSICLSQSNIVAVIRSASNSNTCTGYTYRGLEYSCPGEEVDFI